MAPGAITCLLTRWGNGDRAALDELLPIVFKELHKRAQHYLKRERRNELLQPTALINEVYVRLIDQAQPDWENRSHFFAIAARLMRQVLVDYARAQQAAKRGRDAVPLTLIENRALSPGCPPEILELDEALNNLATFDERKAMIIELHYFAGMTCEEIACAKRLTIPLVKRDLRLALAWLRKNIS
jgi:RNA polymerase sigma factor (TIGR02999 family)